MSDDTAPEVLAGMRRQAAAMPFMVATLDWIYGLGIFALLLLAIGARGLGALLGALILMS